ncbi:MAG: VWA domain-containing protein [Elusimicrobia bacterium]|nr:VWA domain-containing protein [Elusimicrobiota bacterium]
MRTLSRFAVIAACAALLASPATGAEPLKKLADKLAKALKDQPNKKAAVLNFSYPDGALSSGSTIVQERLTTHLVEGGKIEVIERNLIKKILEEKKLETTGLIDPATTKELGKLLGVGAIITGTLNDLPKNKTEVNARAIDTTSGKILAASLTKIERTWTDSPVRPGGAVVVGPATPAHPPGPLSGKPAVQLAILLDTSNSMDGLINQARTQLWKIVNELAGSEKGGNNPTVQVALYEYGNDGLGAGDGYIRQVLPFTTDLDHVSEKLFALKTNGGQEYCGWVIKHAVENLGWDPHGDVYKAVFIAGNEPFTQAQDKADFRDSAAAAAKKGIVVNTIFCGPRAEGVSTQWKAGADLSGGDYTNIDQQARVVSIQAPQDDEISRLGLEINRTFIPYGSKGREAKMKQEAQDSNALAAPAAAGMATQRALFKAQRQYSEASSWDLGGALESGQLKESEIRAEELPDNMRGMSEAERKDYIQKQQDERKKIQARINQLNADRLKYVADKEKELAGKGAQTLDTAVINAIHTQAEKKGFNFKK